MVCRGLLNPWAHHKSSTGARIDTGNSLVWGREPGQKSLGTRWEAGPMVEVAKALPLHSHGMRNEVKWSMNREAARCVLLKTSNRSVC